MGVRLHNCKEITQGVGALPHNSVECGLFRIHIGTSAIGGTASSQRRMEGFQMIGMNSGSGHRLGGVGMFGIGRLIPWSFATALMPLRPFILEPHFDAFG